MYSELISKYRYFANAKQLTPDGFFYNTIEDMEKDTTLTGRQQRTAIKNLIELNLIEYDIRGLPATRYFRIIQDETALLSIINDETEQNRNNKLLQKRTTGSDKNAQLEVTKPHSNNTNTIILNNNTKKEEDQNTEANASASSPLFPITPREDLISKNITDEDKALQKIKDGEWKKVTDTDFVHYFVNQHNKRFKEQISLPPRGQSRNTLVAIFRNGFIDKYNISRDESLCDMIDKVQQAYQAMESRQEYRDRFEIRLFDRESIINRLMHYIDNHEKFESNKAVRRISEEDRKSQNDKIF